jgi:hypothetical protein
MARPPQPRPRLAHSARVCHVCRNVLDPILAAAGETVHACCAPQEAPDAR